MEISQKCLKYYLQWKVYLVSVIHSEEIKCLRDISSSYDKTEKKTRVFQ